MPGTEDWHCVASIETLRLPIPVIIFLSRKVSIIISLRCI